MTAHLTLFLLTRYGDNGWPVKNASHPNGEIKEYGVDEHDAKHRAARKYGGEPSEYRVEGSISN